MNRKLKLTAMITGAALVTGGVVYLAMPAEAATADVQFSRIYYNSPGKDTGSNTSLNSEYVQIYNRSAYGVELRKWTITDEAGHTFTFPFLTLPAHRTAVVHTGKGTALRYHRYFNSGSYIWNNTGDTATLRSASGRTYDTCSWKSTGSVTSCNFIDPGPLPVKSGPADPTKIAVPSHPPLPEATEAPTAPATPGTVPASPPSRPSPKTEAPPPSDQTVKPFPGKPLPGIPPKPVETVTESPSPGQPTAAAPPPDVPVPGNVCDVNVDPDC